MKAARWSILAASAATMVALMGCGVGTAISVGKNLAQKDSHIKLWLDGQVGKQSTLKKAALGHSRFKIDGATSTGPTLRFEIEDPDKFGRITMVVVSIHQKFESDYSHQAEFTVIARDSNNPQAQMKPGTDYNLGNPGPDFKTLNLTSQDVSGVTLRPGMEYMLSITVRADRSETAQVYFKTN